MPRSSRHKSSKHSSKEAREHSDSEKDSSLKEKKPREGSLSRHGSRDSASGEKRKHDTKAVENKESVDFVEEYSGSSSKKRREKVGSERWTGESKELELVKVEKDLKVPGESKSRSSRWDDSLGFAGNINEGKRTGSKAESKHHRSERKERGDRDGLDREKKSKDSNKTERVLEAGAEVTGGEGSKKHLGEEHSSRDVAGNTGINVQDDIVTPEDEREVERRVQRKKDSSNDIDKYSDMVHEFDDRRAPAKDDIAKSVKHKEDGDKDGRHKDKFRDDAGHQEEKQPRDSRHSRDYTSTYSNSRIEKKDRDAQLKKSKPRDGDGENDRGRYHRRHSDRDRDERDLEADRDHDNDKERGRDYDRERGREADRDRSKDIDRDREHGRDHERGREKDGDRDRDRERYRRERELERDRTRDRDHENDWDYGSHVERSSGYREDRSRRRSPDDYDDYYYNERPKRAKADADTDRERSITHRAHVSDAIAGSSRGRSPLISRSHAYADKYRDTMLDDVKYGDSREGTGFPESHEKYSKYLYADKHTKLDDYRNEEPSTEKSPGTKASPLVRIEKSPSTSIDHKYAGRPSRRRSIDVDEAERRSSGSNDVIEASANDDRQSRDMTSKRSIGEDYSPAESPFHHKPSHGNWSSLGHGPLNYRTGADSPFVSSMGEDSRGHSGRYRRSVDPNVGRPHGNPWKGGVPHWASPISNGFMHFPHGPHGPPPHAGFPGLLPQFHSPPIFGLRPPMELTHAGIPYHLPEADRFPGHLRPVGWQNMMDGMGHPFHGWDGSNGLFREEVPFYGPVNMSNGRPREAIMEPRKQSVDMMNMEATHVNEKDVHLMNPPGDEFQAAQGHQETGDCQLEDMEKDEIREISCRIVDKEAREDMAKVATEGTPELAAMDNVTRCLKAYLSKLDVSIQLTNPDLYNEYVNLAIYDPSDDTIEDKKENMQVENQETLVSEILLEVDSCLELPVAEDSIFQRAMDLYQSQSFVSESYMSFKFPSPSLSCAEVEDCERVAPEAEMREESDDKHETRASSGFDISGVAHDENEGMVTIATKEMHVYSDLSKLLKVEPDDTNSMKPAVELAPGNVGGINNDDIQMDEMRGEGLKGEEEEQIINAVETGTLVSSSEVSDQLNLSRDSSSVNMVCEAFLPPNESESVIITRIPENASESTH